jgi:hypothetical protein
MRNSFPEKDRGDLRDAPVPEMHKAHTGAGTIQAD